MDKRQERMARNEAFFREVNERIEQANERFSEDVDPDDSTLNFTCECSEPSCTGQLELTRAQYEAVRADPKRFVVLPGHEDTRVATVVQQHEGFTVVEKIEDAAEVAIELDPRS